MFLFLIYTAYVLQPLPPSSLAPTVSGADPVGVDSFLGLGAGKDES